MMKKIVVYQSGTGFTAKYAGWISEKLGCKAKALKQTNLSELSTYDMVIYGGWIFANKVVGLDKIKALNLSHVVVFGVGMSPASNEVAKKIAQQNEIDEKSFFYFEGGCKPEKLGFFKKLPLKAIRKSIEKKTEKTAEDLYVLKTLSGADNTHPVAIKDLVAYCNQ